MNTFCLIAFVPCIILAVWLLVELRKYLSVSKKYKVAKIKWDRIQKQKAAESSRDDFIESVPPPPPDYPPPEQGFLEYSEEDMYTRRRVRGRRAEKRRPKPYRRRRSAPNAPPSDYPEYEPKPTKPKSRSGKKGKRKRAKEKIDDDFEEEVEWD